MTEYEAASLALQKSALTLQQAALAAQQASVWVAAIVGAAQCSLIGYGLYIMRRAAIQRDALHQETMKALDSQHRETMASLENRHQETMKGLEGQQSALMELIRRTSGTPPTPQDG